MRTLNEMEIGAVSGGEWEVSVDIGPIDMSISGDESIQEIAQGAANVLSDAYSVAVGATTDLFEMMANGWNFSATCANGHWY